MRRVAIAGASHPHFMGCWFIEPLELCEELIRFFEGQARHHTRGKTAGGLDTKAKDSTDLAVRPRDLQRDDHDCLRNYLRALSRCHHDYLRQWPFLAGMLARVEVGSFNLQKYGPGGHFRKPHAERTTLATSHRVLAWMTYLNDVAGGGETRFIHQELSVRPERGKTLIWPAEWTHAHYGDTVTAGHKYIVTGWLHLAAPPP